MGKSPNDLHRLALAIRSLAVATYLLYPIAREELPKLKRWASRGKDRTVAWIKRKRRKGGIGVEGNGAESNGRLKCVLLAVAIAFVALGTASTSSAAVDCFGQIEFKDTEYGHNFESSWSVWRKPITASQAEFYKQAAFAYLVIPADNARIWPWPDALRKDGVYLRGRTVLPMKPLRRKPPEAAYEYELWNTTYKGKRLTREAALVVSPMDTRHRNMVTYKPRRSTREPLIETDPPKRTADQDWDARLVLTQQGRLHKTTGLHKEKWERFKGPGFNNFRNDWRVALCR